MKRILLIPFCPSGRIIVISPFRTFRRLQIIHSLLNNASHSRKYLCPKRAWITLVLLLAATAPSGARAREEITIGLVPEMNVFVEMRHYQALADYLEKRLNINVKLTMMNSYGQVLDRMRTNEVDAAFLGSFTGAAAVAQLGAEPLVRLINPDGSSTYRGILFVRKDSGIKTVKDMRGKIMAFVARASGTGYLFPFAWLKKQGIDDFHHFFKEYYFAGSHDAAIDAVLSRQADIGAARKTVFDYSLRRNPEIKEELVIVAESSPLPSTSLCVLPWVSNEIRTGIRSTLLALDTTPEGQKVLQQLQASRFIAATPADFLPVWTMAGEAGIEIKTYHYQNPTACQPLK